MAETKFNHDQLDAVYPEGIERHYWSRARNSVIARSLRKLKLTNSCILEIGCGTGVVLRALRGHGFDCYGVDLANVPVPNDLVDRMYTGIGFEELSPDLIARIETVLLFDVIEHIEDAAAFLMSIKRTFPKLRTIVVTVPARKELWSNYDVYYGHFRRYSVSSMKELIQKAGFTFLASSYFFHALYIPARLLSLLGVSRNIKLVPPVGVMAGMHRLLACFFDIEQRIIPSFIPGSSLIAAMRVSPEDPL